jgi:TRAP-type mannitol/chloroaromatic compound transport system permease small subunit
MTALGLFARAIDRLNTVLGRGLMWLSLTLVLVQFAIVILRYVFGISFAWLTESLVYMFACMFMLAAGHTLLHNGHVRIDIFYERMNQKTKVFVNIFGALVFLIPTCVLILWGGLPYIEASWKVMEGSRETNGINALYLLKSVILVFAVLLILQALSIIIHGCLYLRGDECGREEKPRIL